MGTFQSDYLIVEFATEDGTKEVDKWINRRRGIYKTLFSKFVHLRNFGVSYIMWYDGSKEWWLCSDKADELRDEFVKIVKKAGACDVLHIQPKGELNSYTACINDLGDKNVK